MASLLNVVNIADGCFTLVDTYSTQSYRHRTHTYTWLGESEGLSAGRFELESWKKTAASADGAARQISSMLETYSQGLCEEGRNKRSFSLLFPLFFLSPVSSLSIAPGNSCFLFFLLRDPHRVIISIVIVSRCKTCRIIRSSVMKPFIG